MREDHPSSTATLIAAATVFLGRDRELSDLVPAGAADHCASYLQAISPRRLKAVLAFSHPALRWVPRLAERVLAPGLPLHFVLRKRWIEEATRSSLDRDCRQVIVIGAGFDTLAQRLCSDYPHARFIEVDHPATQERKRLAVERIGQPGNLRFIAADLSSERLEDSLLASEAFQRDTPSMLIVEGLLMYLTDDAVADFFRALRKLDRSLNRIVLTVMEQRPDGRSGFHNATPLVEWLLTHWGEPFKSSLRRDEAASFLDSFGFNLAGMATAETLRQRYLAPSGQRNLTLAQGEMILVAERAGSR